jgi:hypothetical protein
MSELTGIEITPHFIDGVIGSELEGREVTDIVVPDDFVVFDSMVGGGWNNDK